MPITSMPTVAPGDTIPSAGWNTLIDNINIVDARTGGDPGGADKWLVSTSSVAAAWVARATAVIAAIPNLGIVTAMLNDLAVTTGKLANLAVTAAKLSTGAGSNGQVLGYSGGNLAWFNQSDLTAGNAQLLDSIDSTGFAPAMESQFGTSGGALTLTTSYQTITGVSVTIPTTGTWMAVAACDGNIDAADGTSTAQIFVNGSGASRIATLGHGSGSDGGRKSAAITYKGTITAGQVADLRAKKASGAGGSSVATGDIIAWRVA